MDKRDEFSAHLPSVLRVRFTFQNVLIYPLALLLYAWILHWVYANFISPKFAYLASRYSATTLDAHLITYLIALAVLFCLPSRIKQPSAVVLWVLFIVAAGPTILMAPYTSYLEKSEALLLSSVVGASYIVAAWMQNNTPKPLKIPQVSTTSFKIVVAVVIGSMYTLLIFTQGLSFRFLDINNVNDVRDDVMLTFNAVPILAYSVPILTNVINPFLLSLGLYYRKWTYALLALLGQYILYSTTGAKHIIFSVAACFVIYFLLRKKGTSARGITLLWGTTGLMVISLIIDTWTGDIIWTSLFSRRFLTIPGSLSSAYVHFFTENPKAYLAHSVLSPFIHYPYQWTPPYVVGEWLMGSYGMAASVNLFADGFLNFGYFGLLGATIILGVYLRLLDRAAYGLPILISGITMVISGVVLSNSAVLTSLSTHGLIFALFILAIAPRPDENNLIAKDTHKIRQNNKNKKQNAATSAHY